MKITVTPYADNPEPDPTDPLGLIRIQDDDGKELSVGSACMDEWLSALISGLNAIETGASGLQVDIDSERDPLMWFSDSQTATFTFQGRTIVIRDVEAFRQELRRSALEITDKYRRHSNWKKCAVFRAVRYWAEQV